MTKTKKYFDVIIVGAGAAGMMCAMEAAGRGRRVLLVEHNDKPGKKIRISGGGRCNFTNLHSGPENFISENPHFFKSALARFTPADICARIEANGIRYHEKKEGQLFCNKSAQEIVDWLIGECKTKGVDVRFGLKIDEVICGEKEERFIVNTKQGHLSASSLVVATGGLSIPILGASDWGYQIARQFGIDVIEPRPGLVPFVLGKEDLLIFGELSGVSIPVVITMGQKNFQEKFRENLLFTHGGLSGPAILQISSYWNAGDVIVIDWLPDCDVKEALLDEASGKAEIKNVLARVMPRRLAEAMCQSEIKNKVLNRYSRSDLEDIAYRLHHWRLQPQSTKGYAKAEVTVGGVDTNELSSQTMEARKVKGLYFIGEVVDVTGHLGGHNFQWAWASGFAAGQVV